MNDSTSNEENANIEAANFRAWFNKQEYSLGNIPNFFQTSEMERAYEAGYKAQQERMARLEAVLGDAKQAILDLADQQAIPDDFYEAVLTEIKAVLEGK